MRPIINRRFWILLSWYISIQCIFGILGESHQTNRGQKHQINRHRADYINTRVPSSIKSGIHDKREMFANENINKIPSNHVKFSRRIDRNPLTTNFINTNKNVANLVSYRRKLEKFENDNTEGGGDKEFYADDIAQRKSNVRHITMHHRHRRASPQNNTEDHAKPAILSTTPLPPPPASTAPPSPPIHTINAIVDLNQNSSSDKTFYEKSELSDALNAIENQNSNSNEQIIILSNTDELDSNGDSSVHDSSSDLKEVDSFMLSDEPRVLPLRPIISGPYDDEHQGEMSVVYAEPHTEVRLNCDVDLDVASTVWMKDGQMVHTTDRNSRPTDNRFIREVRGGLTITNAMLEDDGKWQCEAENAKGYIENARPVKLVILDRPKAPYLLIDSRRLDAGNIFVPVKENSELSLACISEGGNPKPTLTWEVLLSPGVDRHSQKVAAEVLELQEVRNDKLSEKDSYKVGSGGAKSEAKMPAVYRAHHNARILCVMEHPTLKMRQNASLLLDVQYTPSFAISRTPGFGYPLREGIEVSLKCDVDSNPPSTPLWQKDEGDTPVPQNGDGFLNFTSIRREHSGWYKCTSRHLNFQYSSIGYYLSVRYDSVDVTSEPLDQDVSVAASHNPNKRPQLEVQLGGAVTLQCPQGSLGCWSHLDPVSARLRGLGAGLTTPTGQFSLKDVVYQDAGIYKCIGQSVSNKKKLEIVHTVAVQVKGAPTVATRNHTPVAYPGSPLHLSVEFCANPPAFAARWLHGDRIYTPGNQYGIDVLAYGVIDLPTPYCKEARLTYVHMHERVPRTFYFVVSSPAGVAETIFQVNFTLKHKEEIHFPVFGKSSSSSHNCKIVLILMYLICVIMTVL
ncbi:uncharacterized protein LOC119085315 isoform X2 [Bradysia coprophila]|uniref:uncharacterized protein LOC119085315 isoform X2 n=1 Tax=Bradysia coprophila TaxID=38358 RepID=UPI00187D7797|nr:uncharacterized protein LOC119085315 isoform X2 [Bradysia coprophila]